MQTMKKLFLFLVISVQFFVLAQEIKLPDNFIETSIPKIESKEWYSLNNAGYYQIVKINKGKLLTQKDSDISDDPELKIAEGKLVGVDNGEWGGELYFQPKNSIKKIKIMSGNIVDIFKFKNKIYIAKGLAHLGSSSGAIYELIKNNDNFSYKKILDFENDAPAVLTNFRNKTYMVSNKGFFEIDLENNTYIEIFGNQFWRALYPKSIAIFDEKNIFIGIRGGIIKINSLDKTIKFYQEKNKISKKL